MSENASGKARVRPLDVIAYFKEKFPEEYALLFKDRNPYESTQKTSKPSSATPRRGSDATPPRAVDAIARALAHLKETDPEAYARIFPESPRRSESDRETS